MKKDYIVELREEEADELMDDHWVGELVRCNGCKYLNTPANGVPFCKRIKKFVDTDWFCADGRMR